MKRRLDGLAEFADLHVLRPVPWFPGLRGRRVMRPMIAANGLPVTERRMFYLPGLWQQTTAWWLRRAIMPILDNWARAGMLDVIDAHFGYPEGVGCWGAARRLGVPYFITVRGNEAWYVQQPKFRELLLSALREATGVISVSHCLRDVLIDAGLDGAQIAVIPNGLTTDVFYPGSQAEARDVLGLPADRRFVIYVGRLDPGKGCHTLIRAFQTARRRHPDLELLLVGRADGHPYYARALRQQVAAEKLEKSVHFVGSQSPAMVAHWLRAADVFAHLSRREGCCNAVLEALACGLPVVATNVGDNARYVFPERNGYVVDPDCQDAFDDALDRTLNRSWNRTRIAQELPTADWRSVGRDVNRFFRQRLTQ